MPAHWPLLGTSTGSIATSSPPAAAATAAAAVATAVGY